MFTYIFSIQIIIYCERFHDNIDNGHINKDEFFDYWISEQKRIFRCDKYSVHAEKKRPIFKNEKNWRQSCQ